MTYQEAIDKSCALGTLIMNLLKGTDTESFDGIPSMRKIVLDNKDKTASVWSSTKQYIKGDLVSYNNNLYIALQSSLNNLPTDTAYWKEKTIHTSAGTLGFDKVLTFNGIDGTIYRGVDYFTITKLTTGHYRINFITEYTIPYLPYIQHRNKLSIIETDYYNFMITDKQTTYLEFKSYKTTDMVSYALADSDEISITIMEIY